MFYFFSCDVLLGEVNLVVFDEVQVDEGSTSSCCRGSPEFRGARCGGGAFVFFFLFILDCNDVGEAGFISHDHCDDMISFDHF